MCIRDRAATIEMEPAKHGTRLQTLLREKEVEEEARRLEKEIEKGARMEEKEVTSVEDVEELLTPMEIDKPTQQAEARTGMDLLQLWEKLDKKFESINDNFKKQKEEMKDTKKLLQQNNEELNKKFESLNEKFDRNEIERSNEKTSETLRPVSYTHLDVYKRQAQLTISI